MNDDKIRCPILLFPLLSLTLCTMCECRNFSYTPPHHPTTLLPPYETTHIRCSENRGYFPSTNYSKKIAGFVERWKTSSGLSTKSICLMTTIFSICSFASSPAFAMSRTSVLLDQTQALHLSFIPTVNDCFTSDVSEEKRSSSFGS